MKPLLLMSTLLLCGCAHEVPRGRAFWVSLKDAKFTLPVGTTRAEVLHDAVALTDEPESLLRDEVGYGLVVQWIYRDHALTADELKTFTGALITRMQQRDASVLGRSFSALSLSIVAAAETKQPMLDDGTWSQLVEAACTEIETEDDLRGHDATLGWIHATAHTADLLKFLARDSRLSTAQQHRIVTALTVRLARAEPLSWGEDERLAAVFRSLVMRADFDTAPFDAWLATLTPQWKALWESPSLNRANYLQLNATKQVLRALLLTLPEDSAPGKRIAETLATLAD
jgi:hypothetical protein